VTVTGVHKDPQRLSMTIEAEFDASPERVWQLWADPRQLERWWGPPGYSATVTRHELKRGSHVVYQMTGPRATGTTAIGRSWRPRRSIDSSSATGSRTRTGSRNTDMPPATTRVTIEEVGVGRTRMSIESSYPSVEAIEWVLGTGTDVARMQAVGQVDTILAEQTIQH
jgi:uncharacterized protein YndB with AHSA1/START domain